MLWTTYTKDYKKEITMKTTLELLNEIQCPYVRQRAVNQFMTESVAEIKYGRSLNISDSIERFKHWDETKEGMLYWIEVSGYVDNNENIDESESLQFEKYLPENYDGIKRGSLDPIIQPDGSYK